MPLRISDGIGCRRAILTWLSPIKSAKSAFPIHEAYRTFCWSNRVPACLRLSADCRHIRRC